MTDSEANQAGQGETQAEGGGGLGRWFIGFLFIAVVGLSALVLKLATENRELKAQLSAKLQAESMPKDAIKVGESVGPVRLMARSGPIEVSFDGAAPATLFLEHSAGCGFCEETMPIWVDAVRSAGVPGLRVMCVQVGAHSTDQLIPVEPPLQACWDPDPAKSWLKRAAIVPSAVLVVPGTGGGEGGGGAGVVKRVWIGQMTKDQGKELVIALLEAAADAKKP